MMKHESLTQVTVDDAHVKRDEKYKHGGLKGEDVHQDSDGIVSKNYATSDICVAVDDQSLREIRELRKREYSSIYPDMDLDNDQLDQQAIILFTRNSTGQINSTARLGVDGCHELPEEKYLERYRESGQRMMEWGRFIIVDGNIALLKSYYEMVFTLATRLGYDAVVMAMKPKDISFHIRLIGVKVIERDMGISYGGPYSLACVVWELETTKPSFYSWICK